MLERLDRAIAELQAIRAALSGDFRSVNVDDAKGVNTAHTLADDDLADGSLIEISQAVELFNRPADSLRWMCRTQGCGKKIGGRWMASPARIRRHLNGG